MENETLRSLRALTSAYLDRVAELERNRKFPEGLFGIKGGPKDDPCHERYAEDARALLTAFAASKPGSEDTAAVLRELFSAAEANRDAQCAYWMLIAVQGLGLPLVEALTPADAAALCGAYRKQYPRRMRLPVQDEILKRLQKAAG